MRLKISLLSCMVLILGNALCQDSAARIIPWTATGLSFEHFKGQVPAEKANRPVAATRIRYDVVFGDSLYGPNRDSLTLQITTYFMPYSSYFSPLAIGNRNILIHELGHFDIGEIKARQLRKEIQESKLSVYNFKTKIKRMMQRAFDDYDRASDLYDSDTYHDVALAKQKEWNTKIYLSLKELEPFKSTLFTICLRR